MTHARLELDLDSIPSRWIGRGFQREINVCIAPCEPWWSNTNDGVVLMYQLNRLAKNIALAVVMPLPKLVTQHCYRLWVLAFRCIAWLQAATKQRRHA